MELIIILLMIFIYFLPAIMAWSRENNSIGAIFVLNLFAGWTLLGWVVALVWSFKNPEHVVISNENSNSAADEIQKFANLKEQGLLTDEEFNKKKSEILNNM